MSKYWDKDLVNMTWRELAEKGNDFARFWCREHNIPFGDTCPLSGADHAGEGASPPPVLEEDLEDFDDFMRNH